MPAPQVLARKQRITKNGKIERRKTFIVHEDKESETKSRAHTKGCHGYDTEIEMELMGGILKGRKKNDMVHRVK